jgi:hypothetical protein
MAISTKGVYSDDKITIKECIPSSHKNIIFSVKNLMVFLNILLSMADKKLELILPTTGVTR